MENLVLYRYCRPEEVDTLRRGGYVGADRKPVNHGENNLTNSKGYCFFPDYERRCWDMKATLSNHIQGSILVKFLVKPQYSNRWSKGYGKYIGIAQSGDRVDDTTITEYSTGNNSYFRTLFDKIYLVDDRTNNETDITARIN